MKWLKEVINRQSLSHSIFTRTFYSRSFSLLQRFTIKNLLFFFANLGNFVHHCEHRQQPSRFTLNDKDESKGLQIVPQPTKKEANIAIWKTQMLIPFLIVDKLLAFNESYPDPKSSLDRNQKFFSCHTFAFPLVFELCALDLRCLDPTTRVFRLVPTFGNKDYLVWLKKVNGQCQTWWEDICILNVIQLSRNGHRVNPCMLLASIFLWESLTNTFPLPCGMITPTVFDVEAFTGLSLLDEVFDLTIAGENSEQTHCNDLNHYFSEIRHRASLFLKEMGKERNKIQWIF